MSLLSRAQSLLAARAGAMAALAIVPLATAGTAHAISLNIPVTFNQPGVSATWSLNNTGGAPLTLGSNFATVDSLPYNPSDNVAGIGGSGYATVSNIPSGGSGGGTADLTFDFNHFNASSGGAAIGGSFITNTIPGRLLFYYNAFGDTATVNVRSYDYQVTINGETKTNSTGNAILPDTNDVGFDINVPNASQLNSWDASVTFHLDLASRDQVSIEFARYATFDINPTTPNGGGSVPEPASLGLLATAGLALLARRRKA